jgi:hypothetical protein
VESAEIIKLIRATAREDFVAAHTWLFLILTAGEISSHDLGFNTVVSDRFEGKRRSSISRKLEVVEVKKRPGNPYPDRISVGRTRNCDIVLRDPSVSKLHAHFRLREGGAWELVDLESQNGTCKNGTPLAAHTPEPIVIGDLLLFGAVQAKLVDAGLLHDFLK